MNQRDYATGDTKAAATTRNTAIKNPQFRTVAAPVDQRFLVDPQVLQVGLVREVERIAEQRDGAD